MWVQVHMGTSFMQVQVSHRYGFHMGTGFTWVRVSHGYDDEHGRPVIYTPPPVRVGSERVRADPSGLRAESEQAEQSPSRSEWNMCLSLRWQKVRAGPSRVRAESEQIQGSQQ